MSFVLFLLHYYIIRKNSDISQNVTFDMFNKKEYSLVASFMRRRQNWQTKSSFRRAAHLQYIQYIQYI